MIIGVDYYETDKADVRDYKTWNTSCTFRWIYGCVLLHTEGSGFCQCPDRKHVAVWCKFVRGALHYFFPVFAFAIGIAIAELVRAKERDLLHWRQVAVLFEGIILVGVAFIPLDMNLIANSLTSFACGIQVESFRKIRGNGIATTMCIGNLRSGTQNLCNFIRKKDKEDFKKAALYYGIIVCFVTGAVIGNFFIHMFHERAILCCSVILFFAFFLMFIDYEKDDARAI